MDWNRFCQLSTRRTYEASGYSLSSKAFYKSDFQVKYFIYVVFGILGLVMLEPDMGTAIIIFLVSMTMYFMSGYTLKLFIYWCQYP